MKRFSDSDAAGIIGAAAKRASTGVFRKKASTTRKTSKSRSNNTGAAKPAPKTTGPDATHARDMDTGQAVKLTRKERNTIKKYDAKKAAASADVPYSQRQFKTPATKLD
jgi:hypothetical protein